MKMHPSITEERVCAAVERGITSLDNPGMCVSCGQDQDGCEPDARNYTCESCGARSVFGAEELLFRLN